MRKLEITLKNGTLVTGDFFDDNDYHKIKLIFEKWRNLNQDLASLGGRAINVPDVVSEALYCYFFHAIRTNATTHAGSYDAINIDSHNGIQIKSTSIESDLTSFGPNSTWDELWFIDFAPNGTVDGQVDFYKIDISIKDIILNSSKNQTFADQQTQGRRPRFSIKEKIIKKHHLKPIKTIYLN